MNCKDYNRSKSYHTVALRPEVILSLKKLGAMGDSYNTVVERLIKLAESVGAEKEDKP